MRQATFVTRRSTTWEELETLLARNGRRGLRGLDPEAVERVGRLYRATTSDLAYAQGRDYDATLLTYLNRLVARTHALVYGATSRNGWQRVRDFYAVTFPAEFRRSWLPIATCIALTVASATFSYAIVRAEPGYAVSILGPQLAAPIHKSLHDSNFKVESDTSPLMSSMIITNNIRVAFTAFAGCITLGILTVYIILSNGLMLGGMGAMYANAGFGSDFWATVAPHGVIELTAIQIAGAAGLMIAMAVVAPGRRRRRDAVPLMARRAGTLIAGVASMLCVAGTIEGFYSPLRLPPSARIAFGALTAVLLVAYFGLCGLKARRAP